ncbi:homeobox-leucine zipper protein HDG11-like, partial [Trifolium medium]|nr:homeobox-leucine zipper protein HDG11-like [Trifolium medium]
GNQYDGNNNNIQSGGGNGDGASTSSNTNIGNKSSGGSLITVAFQIMVSSLPSAKLNMESVATVNGLIGETVQHIKAALNCPSS